MYKVITNRYSRMIEVACGVMYNKEGKILMGKRRETNENHPNKWEFPGGQKEENENIHECLKREWMEELNLHIEIEKEIHQSISDDTYSCRFFIGKIVDEENLQKNEQDDVLFLHKTDIYDLNLFEGDSLVLDKL